ncbi:GNAT family N-acetyltransferase [candidate division KSB1 bacterium]|nr:GNAT family N-acetyltransferase [candidate division KSB1 bacterium]
MKVDITPLTSKDTAFLEEISYHAIYLPPGQKPYPREIIKERSLWKYIDSWGKETDRGLIAVLQSNSEKVGAIWMRIFSKENPGYGFVAEDIPELSIAVLPEYRGQGIGTMLLEEMLKIAERRYRAVSLSVSIENMANRLYKRLGFKVVQQTSDSYVIIKTFELSPL